MPTSVMPKGVEHSLIADGADLHESRVPTSVMPKGVEHQCGVTVRQADCACVPTSVMPKGVEHLRSAVSGLVDVGSADLCDAERR